MDQSLLNLILKDTFTPAACLKRLGLLRGVTETEIFQKQAEAKQNLPPDDLAWLEAVDTKVVAGLTGANFETIFKATEEAIRNILPLTVFVPFALPDQQSNEIGRKLRESYGDQFLMEVKIDPSLIAGCALAWKGIYQDFSLKKRIETQKQVILNTLKQYIKH